MMQISTKQYRRVSGGFSLVELMVSLTIFAIVMTISTGTLLVMIDANEKAQGEYHAMTNLTFALDSMTREIRTGYNYYCNKISDLTDAALPSGNRDCAGGGMSKNFDEEIVFSRGRDGARVAYRLKDGAIEQRVDATGIGKWLRITSPDIFIDRFEVRAEGTEGGNDEQARVILFTSGHIVNDNDVNVDFRLQTDITERILNY